MTAEFETIRQMLRRKDPLLMQAAEDYNRGVDRLTLLVLYGITSEQIELTAEELKELEMVCKARFGGIGI